MTEDLYKYKVGDQIPPVEICPSTIQLFQFSAVTWNTHRIHYDRDWADVEGYPGVLVHSHLHAANILRPLTQGEMLRDWHVASVSYRVIRPAAAGDVLTATAEITAVGSDGNSIEVLLRELNASGEVCCEGSAQIERRS